ncbi:MAG: glutathione S-transferase [Sneathiella sp.]
MSKAKLVIGNKRYSSWSLRGYLALKFAGIDFDEVVVPLFVGDFHKTIKNNAPDAPAKVPSLVDGGHTIWDTNSIMEFGAENTQKGALWPEDKYSRAHARSICAEMHSGFMALRGYMPMDLGQVKEATDLPEDVSADINRIVEIWSDCRKKYAEQGPYLFGKLSMADAAYAPVVARFMGNSIALDDVGKAYMQAIWDLPAFEEWRRDAATESWIINH